VQLISVSIVAVDDFLIEGFPGVLLALVPFLVEMFAPEISPGNHLKHSLNVEAKEIADGFRRELFLSKVVS
jgi:hypothetical protein